MSNTNGNVFPAWGINNKNQVFAVDTFNNIHPKSEEGFAEVIGISLNGVVWAIGTTPDPVSGSIIYYSLGDGNWTPAGSNFPGAVLLTGAGPDTAFFYTEDGTLWNINISEAGKGLAKIEDITQLDYGNGYAWAVFPEQPGGIPCLQFWKVSQQPMKWQPFNGAVQPSGISANYSGDCYGVVSYSPVYYSHDGVTTNSAGSGANGSTLEMSFKNTFYLLSTNANAEGNEVMYWDDVRGGTFVNAGFRAIQVLGTYYLGS